MTPHLIHPEALVREFPQPTVLEVPDTLLTPAPAPVQDIQPVGMTGPVGDKSLHPTTVHVGDAQLRTRGRVFHPDDDPHIRGEYSQL